MAELVRTAQAVQMECVATSGRYEQVRRILGFLCACAGILSPGLSRPAPNPTFTFVAAASGGIALYRSLRAIPTRLLVRVCGGSERQEAERALACRRTFPICLLAQQVPQTLAL